MTSLEVSTDKSDATRARLTWVMAGRLFVATVLLGGTLVFGVDAHGYHSFTPLMFLGLVAATYVASFGFAVWLPRARRTETVAVAQLGWDLLFVTVLLYVSGAATSVFSFLYGIAILIAAIVLGPRAAATTAAGALLLYATLTTSVSFGLVPHPPDQSALLYLRPIEELGLDVFSTSVGLGLVALLAGNLASRLRRTGGQLIHAERSAADLAQRNDDIVRSLSSGLLTMDPAGRIQTVNPAAAELLRTDEDALAGTALESLLPTGEFPTEPGGAVRGEGTAHRPDGSSFPVGYTASSLVNGEGRSIGTLLIFQDLTEIRQLRLAAERADRLAALGRLATGLAHEIRNPLSSISGSVELIREAPGLGEEDRRLLGVVLSEVERLNDLVTTMLGVGKPPEPSLMPTDLAKIAVEVVEIARKGLAGRAHIQVEIEAPAPVIAKADPGQARQVLWNLLKNAVQATPDRGEVRVVVEEGPEKTAVVEVRDRGPGVDELAKDRLFETFYSGRPHGIGLGLTLVKQIVEGHGAQIEIESQEGGGTIFRVVFAGTSVAGGAEERHEAADRASQPRG